VSADQPPTRCSCRPYTEAVEELTALSLLFNEQEEALGRLRRVLEHLRANGLRDEIGRAADALGLYGEDL
jgi:hypothetical protein